MDKWFEIFRVGQYPQGNFGENDIKEIIQNFIEEENVPVVIGHPKDNHPVYGVIEALKEQGGLLKAKFKMLSPELIKTVNKGLYKKVSVRLSNKPGVGWKLIHVGFLGAKSPGVEGLKSISFSSSENKEVTDIYEIDFAEIIEEHSEELGGPSKQEDETRRLYEQTVNTAKSKGVTYEEAASITANMTGSFNGEPVDKDRLELHLRITGIAEEKGISYKEALELLWQEQFFAEDIMKENHDKEMLELHKRAQIWAQENGVTYTDAVLAISERAIND